MIETLLAASGLFLICSRLLRLRPHFKCELTHRPIVSIIIPARNEEQNLPALLKSLRNLHYENIELIVVDDQSTDRTREIAKEFNVNLIEGQNRPVGWKGKQWACHQGAIVATGAYLLFTDADTVHEPHSLTQAIALAQSTKAHLISCLPWHSGKTTWEQALGIFHIILISLTAPFSKPKKGRLFAIGQYLLFERTFYSAMGGHQCVKDDLVEDIPLATRVVELGGKLSVWEGEKWFEVRMYSTLAEFIQGWRRNFRAGMRYSKSTSPLEAGLIIAAYTGGAANVASNPLPWIVTLISLACSWIILKRIGRFGPLSILMYPFSLLIFCLVSLLAAVDTMTNRPMVWKNRTYKIS